MTEEDAPQNLLPALTEQYWEEILFLAFVYIQNWTDAEDIVREVFFTYTFKHGEKISPERIHVWLLRVTVNKCKMRLRGAVSKRERIARYPHTKEEKAVMMAILDQEEKYRIPLHLYFYEGYSIADIADILRIGNACVRERLHYGTILLKKQIGGDLDAIIAERTQQSE